eukprot:4712721-Prymnesium_polylepis.1
MVVVTVGFSDMQKLPRCIPVISAAKRAAVSLCTLGERVTTIPSAFDDAGGAPASVVGELELRD